MVDNKKSNNRDTRMMMMMMMTVMSNFKKNETSVVRAIGFRGSFPDRETRKIPGDRLLEMEVTRTVKLLIA